MSNREMDDVVVVDDVFPVTSSRKRKEEITSASDSDCIKAVSRRRRKIGSVSPEKEKEKVTRQNEESKFPSPAEVILYFCRNLNGSATAEDLKYIKKKVKVCQRFISDLQKENEELKRRLEENEDLGSQMKKLSETITGAVGQIAGRQERRQDRESVQKCENMCVPVSYAGIVKKNSVGGKMNVGESLRVSTNERANVKTYAVIVKSKNENENTTSEKIREKVIKEMSEFVNVRVKAVRKIRNNGVVIETVSEQERNAIKECVKLDELGLKANLPGMISPKVIMYDVPNEMKNETILEEMYEKNLKERMTLDEFNKRVRIINRSSKKGANEGNVIMETSAIVKEMLTRAGRVYIKWHAFKVREFECVLRCFGCLGFGHMMRDCKSKVRVCRKCGESGHEAKDCTATKETCKNCRERGMNDGHSVMSNECPQHVRMIERMRERIRYD
ncbi:uncharacterized protein LOC143154599 [Ptiloglossa arizonensis]|uniref:uncharacterized protein LOC143154599 n=1 Tax=Ptiloglossa arizonensis TaxID=3350558 RepID=UPI003FA0F0D5